MRTLIYTKSVGLRQSKLVFDGDVQFQLRAGDQVEILDGFCVEQIDSVYYSIPDNQQEIHLITQDFNNEYPVVEEKI